MMTDQQLLLYKKYKKYKLKYREALGGASASETIEVLTTTEIMRSSLSDSTKKKKKKPITKYFYNVALITLSVQHDSKDSYILSIPDSRSFYDNEAILRFNKSGKYLIISKDGNIYEYKKGSDNQPIILTKKKKKINVERDIILKNWFGKPTWEAKWVLKIGRQEYDITEPNKTQIRDYYMSPKGHRGIFKEKNMELERQMSNHHRAAGDYDYMVAIEEFNNLPRDAFNHWKQSLKNTFMK